MLHEIVLGREALAYVRSSLSEGSALSHYLLALPLEEGEVKSCVPAGVERVEASDLPDGGRLGFAGEGWRWVAPFVQAYLSLGSRRYGMFETLWGPDDPAVGQRPVPYLVHEDEVYYLLTPQSTEQEIRSVLRAARSYPFVGALAREEREIANTSVGQRIGAQVLKAVAEGTDHLLIGAYDDDGALVWSRSRGPALPIVG